MEGKEGMIQELIPYYGMELGASSCLAVNLVRIGHNKHHTVLSMGSVQTRTRTTAGRNLVLPPLCNSYRGFSSNHDKNYGTERVAMLVISFFLSFWRVMLAISCYRM